MHPRDAYNGNFIPLAQYLPKPPGNNNPVNFNDPYVVNKFSQRLLKKDFGIDADMLNTGGMATLLIPLVNSHVLWIEDLVNSIPSYERANKGMDIESGPGILPLIAAKSYGWNIIATQNDKCFNTLRDNIKKNNLNDKIEARKTNFFGALQFIHASKYQFDFVNLNIPNKIPSLVSRRDPILEFEMACKFIHQSFPLRHKVRYFIVYFYNKKSAIETAKELKTKAVAVTDIKEFSWKNQRYCAVMWSHMKRSPNLPPIKTPFLLNGNTDAWGGFDQAMDKLLKIFRDNKLEVQHNPSKKGRKFVVRSVCNPWKTSANNEQPNKKQKLEENPNVPVSKDISAQTPIKVEQSAENAILSKEASMSQDTSQINTAAQVTKPVEFAATDSSISASIDTNPTQDIVGSNDSALVSETPVKVDTSQINIAAQVTTLEISDVQGISTDTSDVSTNPTQDIVETKSDASISQTPVKVDTSKINTVAQDTGHDESVIPEIFLDESDSFISVNLSEYIVMDETGEQAEGQGIKRNMSGVGNSKPLKRKWKWSFDWNEIGTSDINEFSTKKFQAMGHLVDEWFETSDSTFLPYYISFNISVVRTSKSTFTMTFLNRDNEAPIAPFRRFVKYLKRKVPDPLVSPLARELRPGEKFRRFRKPRFKRQGPLPFDY